MTRSFRLGLISGSFLLLTGCGNDPAPSGVQTSVGGAAGSTAGGGSGGSSTQAGSGGVAAAGRAGSAGTAGTTASAGTSGGGGAPAVAGACKVDTDCQRPITTPPDCAKATCDQATHQCRYAAIDGDGDGFATSRCKPANNEIITLGNDCDDANAKVNPGAWDGPTDGAKVGACGDGVDQDCSGVVDDGKASNGATCTCTPGEVSACNEASSGQAIVWPTGKPIGACKAGSKTCLAGGQWGPCTDARGPSVETCNTLDDDCDGQVDDDPVDAALYFCDADNDGHLIAKPTSQRACDLPTTGCANWVTSAPKDDCNDADKTVNGGLLETCGDGIDNNCDGQVDEGFDLGKACNVKPANGGPSNVGACLNGGKRVCDGPQQTRCQPLDEDAEGTSIIGTSDKNHAWPAKSSPNGSDDWACDGEARYAAAGLEHPAGDGEPGRTDRTLGAACFDDAQVCNQIFGGAGECTGYHAVPALSFKDPTCCQGACIAGSNCPAKCSEPVIACGDEGVRIVACRLDGGACKLAVTQTGQLVCN